MRGITWSHREKVLLVDMAGPKKYCRRKVTEEIILTAHVKADGHLNCDNN